MHEEGTTCSNSKISIRTAEYLETVPGDEFVVEMVKVAPLAGVPEVLDHQREEADGVDHEDEDDVLVGVGRVVVELLLVAELVLDDGLDALHAELLQEELLDLLSQLRAAYVVRATNFGGWHVSRFANSTLLGLFAFWIPFPWQGLAISESLI